MPWIMYFKTVDSATPNTLLIGGNDVSNFLELLTVNGKATAPRAVGAVVTDSEVARWLLEFTKSSHYICKLSGLNERACRTGADSTSCGP